ncbi:MAG: hypothetical protein LUQ11_06420 [Methylococcaceae bacterium]|nr:hypothetical protein [Methylococcaceae bacterium]
MLLEKYDSQALLWITTLVGKTSKAGVSAFRGDLVLIEGALREGSNNIRDRKTPELVINQAAVLADSDKILFVNGLFYKLEHLPIFVEKYKDALTPDTVALFYVENIGAPMQIVIDGITFNLVPHQEGMIWNETLELLYIEKADLKGQSGEDKVVTMYEAAKAYKSKAEPISLETALTQTIAVKKDAAVGPV